MLECPSMDTTNMVSLTSEAFGSSCNLSPIEEDLLSQPISRMLHLRPQVFNIHAWLLCSNVCKRQAFLCPLSDESIKQKDLPPTICMIPDDWCVIKDVDAFNPSVN